MKLESKSQMTYRQILVRWFTCLVLLVAVGLPSVVPANQGGSAAGAPRFDEIPEACTYLIEPLAVNFLRAEVRPGPANEHIPTFWSKCRYSGRGVQGRNVQFVFKFMTWEMFDVEVLVPQQLQFNATFASGMLPLVKTLETPGKKAFVFEQRDITVLMMVTGFQGPLDGAKQPTAFIATYSLSDPETNHPSRLAKLIEQAEKHMTEWSAGR